MTQELVFLVTQVPCNATTKKTDEHLNVTVNFTYQGPIATARLGAVVTQEVGTSEFDEIGLTRKEVSINLPESLTPRTLSAEIPSLPLSSCEPKPGYGLKVYALDLDGKPEWGCKNVLTIESLVPAPELTVTSLFLS